MQMHLELEDDRPAFRTQNADPRLYAGAASVAISALTASVVALAETCDHEYDQNQARELLDVAETLDPDRRRSRGTDPHTPR